MQKNITGSVAGIKKIDIFDIASAAWAVLVTVLFVAHIFGVPGPEDVVRMCIYPLVILTSVIIAVTALVRRSGAEYE